MRGFDLQVLEAGTQVLGVPVLGGQRYLAPLAGAGLGYAANAVGAIGRIATRIRVSDLIAAAGLRTPVLVEPTASIAAPPISCSLNAKRWP